MKRAFKTIGIFISAILLMAACSSDDDKVGDKDVVEIDYDKGQDHEGIHTLLQLLNKEGVATKTFKEGENIYFKLYITNNRKETINLPDYNKFIGKEAFKVFTSDHITLGAPYDDYLIGGASGICSGDTLTLKCPWLDDQSEITPILVNDPNHESGIRFVKLSSRPIIRKGDYYTEFTITFSDDTKITCRKEFKVI